jgi:hypothetical protein
MAAEQAAGIPLLSHLGCHQIIQPSHTPRHRSHLADEAYHSPYSWKNHDGSLARMLDSVKFAAILNDSLPEKTVKKKGIRVLQVDCRLASQTSDSVSNMQTGHSGKTLTSGLLPRSPFERSRYVWRTLCVPFSGGRLNRASAADSAGQGRAGRL